MFSGFNKSSTVPAGNLSKAAFTGAKTVNGPALLSEVVSPAASTAVTRVERSLFPAANFTMVGAESSSTTASWPPATVSVEVEVSVVASVLLHEISPRATQERIRNVFFIFF